MATSPAPPDLPVELTDKIVDDLKDDRRALRVLTLAARRFTDRAKKYLHHDISVSSKRKDEITRLVVAYQGFREHVKVFRVSYHGKNASYIHLALCVLDDLPHLEEVVIEHTKFNPKVFQDMFFHHGTTVHTLHLHDVTFETFSAFASLVAPLRQLRTLYIDTVQLRLDFLKTAKRNPPPLLQNLQIRTCGFTDLLFAWLERLKEVRITQLQVVYAVHRDGTPLFNLMRLLSGSLTHLDLDLYVHGYMRDMHKSFTEPLLSNMPRLQSLTFGSIPLHPGIINDTEPKPAFAWISKVLQDVDITSLQEVQFNCTAWESEEMKNFPFGDVLSVFNTRSFPCLRSVTFLLPLTQVDTDDFLPNVSRIIHDSLSTLVDASLLRIQTCTHNTLGPWRRQSVPIHWNDRVFIISMPLNVDIQRLDSIPAAPHPAEEADESTITAGALQPLQHPNPANEQSLLNVSDGVMPSVGESQMTTV